MRKSPTFCALVALFLAAATSAKDRHETLIFTNVNIVSTRDGTVAEKMTVVIKQGRIIGIGKVGFVDQGREIKIINASGKYMVPGLWDMHVHSAFITPRWDEKVIYPLYIANGVTGVRDMGGDADLLLQRRTRTEKEELLGPQLVLAGPFLARGTADPQTIPVASVDEARDAVDAVKARGFDFVKILSNVPRDSYFAIADESARRKIPFAGHVPYAISAREAVAAGQRSIEHLSGIQLACSSREDELRAQEMAALKHRDYATYQKLDTQARASYDPARAQALFAQMAQSHTWQVPTLVWTQANSRTGDSALEADPRLKYVPASIREQWKVEKPRKKPSPQELAELKAEAAHAVELVGLMHGAGVRFLAGTDGPDPFVFPGFSLSDELELLVKSGFTPLQALQTATLNPALFLRQLDMYGVVEREHVADLVLLDANPLDDVGNTRKIFGVVAGGKYYPRGALDAVLQDVEKLAARE